MIFPESLALPFKLNALTSGVWLTSIRSFESCAILENSIYYAGFLVPEAVARMCFLKKVVLEPSQNLQENTCAKSLF